jgi:hypothetical protein
MSPNNVIGRKDFFIQTPFVSSGVFIFQSATERGSVSRSNMAAN